MFFGKKKGLNMGNKPKGLTERINALVTREDKEILDNHCEENNLTPSEVVRSLIRSLKTA